MNGLMGKFLPRLWGGRAVLGVFAVVLGAQLWLVSAAGTDIPFYDQWDIEGHWLYPGWREGSIGWFDLASAHNGHRITWTHVLNLALFVGNGGQWDPLLQMMAGAVLHAACAAGLMALLAGEKSLRGRWLMVLAVGLFSLPITGWHNALWGFQSQFYFMELFALVAIATLAQKNPNRWTVGVGVFAALAGALAMGAGSLVPLALLAVWGMKVIEARHCSRSAAVEGMVLLGLSVLVAWLHPTTNETNPLQTGSWGEFMLAWGRLLAWPHSGQPVAALVLMIPVLTLIGLRLLGKRVSRPEENVVIAVGVWAWLAAGAAAWSRGGGAEFEAGVPSRYADFMALWPLVNLWSLLVLTMECSAARRTLGRLLATGWIVFLLIGWVGLSAEMWRYVVRPRIHDRAAPERLMQAFLKNNDAAVFTGQPRLLVPHPDLASVRRVVQDPRMAGALPPSLQPGRPMGAWSRTARWFLNRPEP